MRIVLPLAAALLTAPAGCGDDDNGGGDPPDASQNAADANPNAPDAAPMIDAFAGPGCTTNYASCEGNYQDRTGEQAVTIMVSGFSYTPKCITVTQGTTVSIEANGSHPLNSAACSPEDFVDGEKVTQQTYTLNEIGVHGYYCRFHSPNPSTGTGMAGAIQVVE